MAKHADIIMFGRRLNDDGTAGDIVFIDDIPLEDNGQKCNLVCSKCGGRLEAVRKQKGDVEGGFAFLRHAAKENRGCDGHSETAVHSLAKRLLLSAKGRRFVLPPVYWKDGIAHISRYTSTGKWRSFRSNRAGWSFMDHNRAANRRYYELVTCEITDVHDESASPDAVPEEMRADLVLALRMDSGAEKQVAVEIRDTHPKDIDDVRRYAEQGMSVMEIAVGDLDPRDRHLKRKLWERCLGDPSDDFSPMREWLYNNAVGKFVQGKLCWRITSCSDELLFASLRHYLDKMGLSHLTRRPPNHYKENDVQWQLHNIAEGNAAITDKQMWCYDKINDNAMYLSQADSEITFSLCYDRDKDVDAELNSVYDLYAIRWLVGEICQRIYEGAHDQILSREEGLDAYRTRMRKELGLPPAYGDDIS